MCSNFDLADRAAQIRAVWKEQDACRLQRERITILLQGIHLLMSHLEWLALLNKDAEQRFRCEYLIRVHEEELGDVLTLLNLSDGEYVQPGKITD